MYGPNLLADGPPRKQEYTVEVHGPRQVKGSEGGGSRMGGSPEQCELAQKIGKYYRRGFGEPAGCQDERVGVGGRSILGRHWIISGYSRGLYDFAWLLVDDTRNAGNTPVVYLEGGRESFFGMVQGTVSVIQDTNTVPEFWENR